MWPSVRNTTDTERGPSSNTAAAYPGEGVAITSDTDVRVKRTVTEPPRPFAVRTVDGTVVVVVGRRTVVVVDGRAVVDVVVGATVVDVVVVVAAARTRASGAGRRVVTSDVTTCTPSDTTNVARTVAANQVAARVSRRRTV